MGTPKAHLEWHGGTLLRRVAGIVARAVDGPVLVVGAPGQRLPDVPAAVAVLEDPREGRGPLQGLAVGLAAARDRGAHGAFVCATDLPLLHPVVVRRIVDGLGEGVDVALPVVDGRGQPLLAAYRSALAAAVAGWLAAGERRLGVVAERSRVNALSAADLLADAAIRVADPELRSLSNLNTLAQYRAARALPAPRVTVCGPEAGARATVTAATVAGAVVASGRGFDDLVRAGVGVMLDGGAVGDGATPLCAGDVVTLLPHAG